LVGRRGLDRDRLGQPRGHGAERSTGAGNLDDWVEVRRMRWRTAAVLVGALMVLGPWATAAKAGPTPTGTGCAWPNRLDPTVANTLYPDSAANYWISNLPAVPGETLIIRGQYPYGRYMSLTTYTPYLFSVDGLHDTAIAPDPGSTNPFLPGADRYATPRNYTVTVVFGQKPTTPAPNTLYTTNQDGSKKGAAFQLTYRVYRPDVGKNDRGGVPLPKI